MGPYGFYGSKKTLKGGFTLPSTTIYGEISDQREGNNLPLHVHSHAYPLLLCRAMGYGRVVFQQAPWDGGSRPRSVP